MICRHMRLELHRRPSEEWLPNAMRDATCALRSSDPARWTDLLRSHGYELEECSTHCLHNATSDWQQCPLYRDGTPRPLHYRGVPL